MDSVSKTLSSRKEFENLDEVNFAALENVFEQEKDILLFLYPSNCGSECQKAKEAMDMAMGALNANSISHVYGGYFETDQNSTYGLNLQNPEEP